MKKLLSLGLIALFTTRAFADVKIKNDQMRAGADGSLNFQLDIEKTFIFKLLNDKADADAAAGGKQSSIDSTIDLGSVGAGVPAAAVSGLCADITGLTPVAALAVTAQASEPETGVPVGGDTAKCSVLRSGSDIDLLMAIPLESVLSKTGSGTVDISYSRRTPVAPVAGIGNFNEFKICEDPASGVALTSPLPGCTAKTNQLSSANGHTDKMSVLLRARLSGAGALTTYSDYIDIDIVETP